MMSSEKRLLTEAQSSALTMTAAAAGVLFAVGAWLSPARGGAGLLLANFYFVSLALAGLIFISVHNLGAAGWPVLLRRVPEAMSAYLPLGAAGAAAVALGARFFYPWAAPGAAESLGGKAAYLNVGMYALRAAVIWAFWLYFRHRLVGVSRDQDRTGGADSVRRAAVASAGFLVAYALTFTVASVDWLMSLEPRWVSTLYPWFMFAGMFQGGLAALTILVVLLRRRGLFGSLNEHHLHDLGKYVFAFSCFWAYLWFCQYLLIWYANLPDETTHFVLRSTPGWKCLFWINPVLNFVLPFALLLPAKRKRRERTLLMGAGVVLVGRIWDLYMLIMPPVIGPRPRLGLAEPAAFVAAGALFLLAFDRAFAAAAPEPARDPYIDESRHFAGV
jgi:Ni/Fe-hydrogenase subunit HybB-like protein